MAFKNCRGQWGALETKGVRTTVLNDEHIPPPPGQHQLRSPTGASRSRSDPF